MKDKNGHEIKAGDVVQYYQLKDYGFNEIVVIEEETTVGVRNGHLVSADNNIPLKHLGLKSLEDVKNQIFGLDRKLKYSEEEMAYDREETLLDDSILGFVKVNKKESE